MCLAIVKPSGATIPEKLIEISYMWNNDGAGVSFVQDGQIITRKGMWNLKKVIKEISKIPNESVALVHLRASSHGAINSLNCHPFIIDNEFSVIHNGCIPRFGKEGDRRSDTRHFVEDFLTPLIRDIKRNEGDASFLKGFWFKYIMFRTIGQEEGRSKMAILHKSGLYAIYGEKNGMWLDGVWYSNPLSIKMTPLEYRKMRLLEEQSELGLDIPNGMLQAIANVGGTIDPKKLREALSRMSKEELAAVGMEQE